MPKREQPSQGAPIPMGDQQHERETNPRLPLLRFGYARASMIAEAFQHIKFGAAEAQKFGTDEGFPGRFLKRVISNNGNIHATIEISAQDFADLIIAATIGIPDTNPEVPRRKTLVLNPMENVDLAPRKEKPSNPLLANIADAVEQELSQGALVVMNELAQENPELAHEFIQETALVERAQMINGLAELRRILGAQRPPKRLGLSEHALDLVEQHRELIDELLEIIHPALPRPEIPDELPPEVRLMLEQEARDRSAFQDASVQAMFGWTTGSFTTEQAKNEIARLQDEDKRLTQLALEITQPMQAIKPNEEGPENNEGQAPSGKGTGGRR